MVKLILKNVRREIRASRPRYLALLAIFALGVGFFAGLNVTTYDMETTVDAYFDRQQFQDLRLISEVGFTEGELSLLRAEKEIAKADGFHAADALADSKDGTHNVKILSLSDQVDLPELTEGRMPQAPNECLMDMGALGKKTPALGETLTLSPANGQATLDTLSPQTFTVVGYANSPAYLSFQRGSSTLGDGETDFFILVNRDAFASPVYTEVCVTVEGAEALNCYGDDYADLIDTAETRLGESTVRTLQQQRASKQLAALSGDPNATAEPPAWYFLDRTLNAGAEGFHQDAQRIGNIARVFPLLFFLVAALVCMTTMTRMVDEQRTQIGTLKALGFGKTPIAAQFLLYAGSACLIGGTLGICIGFQVLPRAIWAAYNIMYALPALQCAFHWGYALASLAPALALSCGITWLTALKYLRSTAAALMRPAAPKSGKKVLLERISPLWKRLSFTSKVTVRNLFRYKKRFFMTVIGIGGCTALLLTGFGLRDSILGIVPTQYEEIYHYDMEVTLAADTPAARAALAKEGNTLLHYTQVNLTADGDNGSPLDCYAFIPEDPALLEELITLRSRTDGTALHLSDGGVIVSEKLATRYNLKVGDRLSLQRSETEHAEAKILGITEHYVFNYVYCTPAVYEQLFGTVPPALNCLMTVEGDPVAASERLLEQEEITAISRTEDMLNNFNKIFGSLNLVVYVLIICASLLAFIVLYNLTNINITERNRELATLKVLGFFDRETDAYLYRENIILTLIGCGVGLFLGIFLHRFVIVTAEVDMVMFTRSITPLSFILSAVLTFVFAAFVNFVMHFRLKKIDMTESLKSVE
ncbi:MAG: FtsX-like permease family protein [Clostridia bacterium]|nr:FtsX-like permease family protein [Clostridia bacterium]